MFLFFTDIFPVWKQFLAHGTWWINICWIIRFSYLAAIVHFSHQKSNTDTTTIIALKCGVVITSSVLFNLVKSYPWGYFFLTDVNNFLCHLVITVYEKVSDILPEFTTLNKCQCLCSATPFQRVTHFLTKFLDM